MSTTRRDHVRPAIAAVQRSRPDFWHPQALAVLGVAAAVAGIWAWRLRGVDEPLDHGTR
jgi:hypothetical protein